MRILPPPVDALIVAAQTSVAVLLGLESAAQGFRPFDLLGCVLVGLVSLPCAARTRAPVVVCLFIHVPWIVYITLGYWPVANSLAAMLAVYTVASLRTTGTALACAALLAATWMYGGLVNDAESMASVVAQAVAFPVILCRFGVTSRRVTELADQLRAEQAERERKAVAEERGRIARELHDVVAHHISVISIHTGLASFVFDSDRSAALAALRTIAVTSEETLDELRRMLYVLRAGETDSGPPAPMPGLDRLAELLERVRSGGLSVELRVAGAERPLAPGVGLCAYRVVQEALTNVVKHAHATKAIVQLRYLPERLVVTVTDDGTGVTKAAVPYREPSTGGHGLIGMRERAKLYGGTIDIGPGEDGGFTVRLSLPTSERAPGQGEESPDDQGARR